jgi:hypothetical protein
MRGGGREKRQKAEVFGKASGIREQGSKRKKLMRIWQAFGKMRQWEAGFNWLTQPTPDPSVLMPNSGETE